MNQWFLDDSTQYVAGRDEHELDRFLAITNSGTHYQLTNSQANPADANFDQLLQAMASWEANHPGEAPTIDSLDATAYENRWLIAATT